MPIVRRLNFWFTILAFGLAVFLGAGLGSARADVVPSAAPAAGAQGETKDDEAPPASPEEGDTGDDVCSTGRRAIEQYLQLYASGACAGHASFHSLIALVPDPVASGRSDWFDSALEGVEEAVAAGSPATDTSAGTTTYVRDRDWLPWPGADSAKKAARCWTSHPGVVLYRPADGACDKPGFLVLLVGETPTWGVRAEQLAGALAEVDELEAWERTERVPEYRILGPTFSGSAASVAAVLRSWSDARRDPASYSIVSGSATNPKVRQTLEGAFAPGSASSVSYQTTTPSDDELVKTMLAFLEARGARCEKTPGSGNIVLLTESLTTYGRAAGAAWDPTQCFRELKYPPNLTSISQVYSAVADTSSDAGAATPPPARGQLSDQTPYAHSLALGEVLREISRERTRFVGIVATDARDVLVLAQRIHEQLPDIRLFTFGADIRYVDPAYASSINGMLVAHAAPQAGPISSISQANELVRGVYGAGRRLLGDGAPKPSVRISLVGNGALWQIGPDDTPTAAMAGVPVSAATAAQPPQGWRFVFILFSALLGAVVIAILSPRLGQTILARDFLGASKTTGFLRHRGYLWTLLGRCEHADLAADDAFATAALVVVSGCPALLMAVSWFGRDGSVPPFGGAALCVAAASALFLVPWSFAVHRRPDATRSAAGVAIAATTAALFGLGMGCGQQRESTFNLLSGGSPVLAGIVGFTMVGVGLWSWRVRLRFLDTHRFGVPVIAAPDRPLFGALRPPIAEALGDDDTGLAKLEARLLDVLRSPWSAFVSVPVGVHLSLLASLSVVVWVKTPHTLEPSWRNALLVAFGGLTLLPITGNLSRLLTTWVLFGRLLRRIASHPAAAALAHLPLPLVRPLPAQLAASGRDIDALVHALRILERLAQAHPPLDETYRRCAEQLAAEMRYDAGDLTSPPMPSTATARAVADGILDVSYKLSKIRPECDEATRTAIDDFSACLLSVLVARYVRHFALCVPPLVFGSLLCVLMSSLYFVQPQRLITSVIFVWVAVVVLTMLMVYLSLDRDPVISGISGTTAGAVTFNWALLQRIVSWGLLPIGSLVAAQYPGFTFWISTVFDSLAKGFR